MTVFSCLPEKAGNGTRKIVSLSMVLVLSFFIVSHVSVGDARAGVDAYGPSQFMRSQCANEANAFTVLKTIGEKFSIESDSTGMIFKRGRANVNDYLDGGSTLLKQFVGVVFAPLFYCFQHPLILLVAFFCLSVLFILMEHIMNVSKGDEWVSNDGRNRNRGKRYQNAAPHVLFMKEQERRSRGDRKSLPDKQRAHIS